MAATNVPETLDPALKRPGRFDRMVAVPLPDIKGRTELLQYYLQDKPAAADINAKLIARQTGGFSGADLANLINEAALLAAKRGADFIDASMVDYAWDKIRMGVERKSAVRSPEVGLPCGSSVCAHVLADCKWPPFLLLLCLDITATVHACAQHPSHVPNMRHAALLAAKRQGVPLQQLHVCSLLMWLKPLFALGCRA